MSAFSCSCSREGVSKVTIDSIEMEETNQVEEWKEMKFKAAVKPYSVKQDLSNIVNISKAGSISVSEKNILYHDLFMIKKPSKVFEQPFNLYEQNTSEGIPNFITCDSILHVYSLVYDYVIRNIEKERLIDELKSFTKGSFKKSLDIYYGVKENDMKKAALKNVAYFGIAMKLLGIGLPGGIPIEANRIIDNDVKKVRSRWGSGSSEIFPYNLDYRKYIVQGHYTRDSEFANYFLTMMWYGSTPILFDEYDSNSKSYKRVDEGIAMSILMASQTLSDENLRKQWDDLYKVTTSYFGKTGDLSIYDLSEIIKSVYGEKIDFNKVWNPAKMQKVYEAARHSYILHTGQSLGGKLEGSDKNTILQAQFRIMGQMYSLDGDIYNNLNAISGSEAEQVSLLPKGLSILSALGSDKAYAIFKEEFSKDKASENYTKGMGTIRKIVSENQNPSAYSYNNSLMWILSGGTKSPKPGYPSFMLNNHYGVKQILAYSGGISDIRHMSDPNAKSGVSKPVKPENRSEIPGYVEPDVNLYSRLKYISESIKAFLSANNFTNIDIYNCLDSFSDCVSFLKDVSVKELSNAALTKDEDKRMRNYADELKSLMLSAADSKTNSKQWETVTRTDRNMACVTDTYIGETRVLQTAIGSPYYIYVVIPYGGKLYLTRGSVYTYNEVVSSVSRKLRDSEWQGMIANGKEPKKPDWELMK